MARRPTPCGQRIQPLFARSENVKKKTVKMIFDLFGLDLVGQQATSLGLGRDSPEDRLLGAHPVRKDPTRLGKGRTGTNKYIIIITNITEEHPQGRMIWSPKAYPLRGQKPARAREKRKVESKTGRTCCQSLLACRLPTAGGSSRPSTFPQTGGTPPLCTALPSFVVRRTPLTCRPWVQGRG